MTLRRRGRSEDGATTVEFALVVPMFIALIGIGVYFAWIFFSQTQLDRAANRAARTAAVQTTSGEYGYCLDMVVAEVNASLFTAKVEAAEVTVSDGTGTALVAPQPSASPSPVAGNYSHPYTDTSTTPATQRQQCLAVPEGFVKVKVTHEFGNPFSSIIGWFTGAGSGLKVTGTGQVRVEHE